MQISPEYEKYIVGFYPHWIVLVANRQYCPGKVIIWSREEVLELTELSADAWLELQYVQRKVQEALESFFWPDKYNVCKLGNSTAHLHLHVIPRYAPDRDVLWRNTKYVDEFWGKNFFENGYSDEARVPEADVLAMAEALRAHLELQEIDPGR